MSNEDIFSFDEIKQIAVSACDGDEGVEVIDHYLEPYSKYKVGFLGNHQSLKVTVKPSNKSDNVTLKFFAKSVPQSTDSLAEFVKQRRVFNQEAEFFNKVTPHLVEAMAAGGLEQWGPKCFLANEKFIVLEDLRDKGFAMPHSKVLDVDVLKSCIRTMARLHASSMLAEKRLGKSLCEMYPQACVEQIFNEHTQKQGASKMIASLVADVAKKHGKSSEGVLDAVDKAFETIREKSELQVICHGDSWSNNLMLDSGKPPKCLLVDFQLVRYANPMFDIAELLYLSSAREVREKEEKELIKTYWSELCASLRKCDPEIEIPSLEELTDYYEKARLTAITNALTYFPIILLSKEVFAEYKEDPEELYKKVGLRRNNDFVLEQMEKDEEYSKMITDVALEIIEASNKLRED